MSDIKIYTDTLGQLIEFMKLTDEIFYINGLLLTVSPGKSCTSCDLIRSNVLGGYCSIYNNGTGSLACLVLRKRGEAFINLKISLLLISILKYRYDNFR